MTVRFVTRPPVAGGGDGDGWVREERPLGVYTEDGGGSLTVHPREREERGPGCAGSRTVQRAYLLSPSENHVPPSMLQPPSPPGSTRDPRIQCPSCGSRSSVPVTCPASPLLCPVPSDVPAGG